MTDTVPPEVVQQVAEYLNVLSKPTRLRLLNLLRDGAQCLQELVSELQSRGSIVVALGFYPHRFTPCRPCPFALSLLRIAVHGFWGLHF